MKDGNLFVDSLFPPSDTSLYFDETPTQDSLKEKWKHYDIIWKRPPEVVTDPQFFVEGGTRFDINQGMFILQVSKLLCIYYHHISEKIPKWARKEFQNNFSESQFLYFLQIKSQH